MSDINEMNEGLRWYVAHTYSGYENKVKTNLEKIIENRGLSHLITEIKIPTETVTEIKEDKKKEVERKKLQSLNLKKHLSKKHIMTVRKNWLQLTFLVHIQCHHSQVKKALQETMFRTNIRM